jgi:hypothetical protein
MNPVSAMGLSRVGRETKSASSPTRRSGRTSRVGALANASKNTPLPPSPSARIRADAKRFYNTLVMPLLLSPSRPAQRFFRRAELDRCIGRRKKR